MPTMVQAGVYSGVLHYLKAVEADEVARTPSKVLAKMKEMPTDDPLFGKGKIRADGRKIHADVPVRGQEAGRVEGQWDYYKLSRRSRPRRRSARSPRASARS